jgi:predicted RNA-binding protein with PUA-like domain
MMKCWLLKSDPLEFSWENLKEQTDKRTYWDGVRNYQARNFLKEMQAGDKAFFYHSVVQPQIIAGIVTIVKKAYPDFTQFDESHQNFDSRSSKDNPIWVMVDIQYLEEIDPPITREEIKQVKKLQDMLLFKNSRLSVQPVSPEEWNLILEIAKNR